MWEVVAGIASAIWKAVAPLVPSALRRLFAPATVAADAQLGWAREASMIHVRCTVRNEDRWRISVDAISVLEPEGADFVWDEVPGSILDNSRGTDGFAPGTARVYEGALLPPAEWRSGAVVLLIAWSRYARRQKQHRLKLHRTLGPRHAVLTRHRGSPRRVSTGPARVGPPR